MERLNEPSTEHLPEIEVLSIKRVGTGGLLFLADVRLGPIVVHGFRGTLHAGNLRIGAPQRAYVVAGERYYEPAITLPEALQEEISQRIWEAWEKSNGNPSSVRR